MFSLQGNQQIWLKKAILTTIVLVLAILVIILALFYQGIISLPWFSQVKIEEKKLETTKPTVTEPDLNSGDPTPGRLPKQ